MFFSPKYGIFSLDFYIQLQSLADVPSLWFVIAAVEWSAEVDQLSEDFFQWYSWLATCRHTSHMLLTHVFGHLLDKHKYISSNWL